LKQRQAGQAFHGIESREVVASGINLADLDHAPAEEHVLVLAPTVSPSVLAALARGPESPFGHAIVEKGLA
jgi:hypothetical protein